MPMLKDKPKLDLVIEHVKTEFAPFWELVFAPMVEGLVSLFNASCFFVPVILIIALYGLLMCCCCPYSGTKGGLEDGYSGPMNENAGRDFIQAARAEYVHEQGPKVGDCFDALGPEAASAFGPFEERIRGADDKARAIEEIEKDWQL